MYNKHDLSNFFAELDPRFQIWEEYFFNFGGAIHIVMATDIEHFKLQMLTFSPLLSYTMSKTINEAMICSFCGGNTPTPANVKQPTWH